MRLLVDVNSQTDASPVDTHLFRHPPCSPTVRTQARANPAHCACPRFRCKVPTPLQRLPHPLSRPCLPRLPLECATETTTMSNEASVPTTVWRRAAKLFAQQWKGTAGELLGRRMRTGPGYWRRAAQFCAAPAFCTREISARRSAPKQPSNCSITGVQESRTYFWMLPPS